MELFSIRIQRTFQLVSTALGAFANIILAGFSQFPEILHNVKQPAVRR